MPQRNYHFAPAMIVAFVGILGFPQVSNAQQPLPLQTALPACPTPSGKIGDWTWRASTNGAEVEAQRFSLVTKGDFAGGAIILQYKGPGVSDVSNVLPGADQPGWSFALEFSRGPANQAVTVIATGAGVATVNLLKDMFTPPAGGRKTWAIYTSELTPLFEGKAGLASAREQMMVEFRDGDRSMTKLTISIKGFNEAFQKAATESKSISQAFAAKKCGVGGGGWFFGLDE